MGEKKEKEKGGITVVLKTDFHCDGCASKVLKCIRSFDGVESVTIDGQKITVVGKVDPAKLREKVEKKTHQKVEQISPPQKKDGGDKEKSKDKDTGGDGGGHGKKEKKKDKNDSKSDDKSDQEKPKEKEPPVTTAVLKLNLHCDGCIHKIYKTVTKTKGYKDMKIDTEKDLVTVTGAMDMKAVADALQKQLKRDVAIVPAKKDKGGGGDDKGKDGDDGGDEKAKGNKTQAAPPGYPFISGPGQAVGDQFHYYPFSAQYHAPQIFSDENPNACSVM